MSRPPGVRSVERPENFTRRTIVPDFSPVITQAYVRILRKPPDAGGLESYNQAMNSGFNQSVSNISRL